MRERPRWTAKGARTPALAWLLLLLPLVLIEPARADSALVVVMSAESDVEALTRDQIINIFLGRFRLLPNGLSALPIDHPSDDIKAALYMRLVNKQPAEIRSYWSRLVFSGKTAPPHQAESRQEILARLAKSPAAIAYLPADELPPDLAVVYSLPP